MKDEQESVDAAEQVHQHLCRFVEASERSPEEIAEEAGMTLRELRGVLRKSGGELHLHELLAVLDGLGISEQRFFGDLYNTLSTTLETKLMALTELLVESGTLTREELEAKIARCRFRIVD